VKCEDRRYYKCVVALVFSVILNSILSYALLYVTNYVSHPVVVLIGWMGIGILVGSLVLALVEGDEDES
jgi:hypothetical protein